MDLDIRVVLVDSVSIVTASGFIDGKTAPTFQTRMLQVLHDADRVLIDLAQVSFMSSAGLRAMLITHQQTQQDASKIVVLAQLPESIRDNMEATGFLPFFQVFDTVKAAFEELCHGQD